MLDDIPSLNILNGKKRSTYGIAEQAVCTSDSEQQRQSHTSNTIKSTKRVKLKEQTDDVPTKKLKKQKDRVEDIDSERYSIAAISGNARQPSKAKQKTKSLSGVISVSKPKVRWSKKDTDISKLSDNLAFGTGQTTQWF